MVRRLCRTACVFQVANATIQEVAKATWMRKGHGVTSQRPDQGACNLPGCRGRGWKRVGSSTALALSTANDRLRATSKRRCLDCDGSGKE
jgi:hypothetical protein